MPPIRARTATGAEFSFPSREEFSRAVSSGRITPDWEVFHARAHRWLPVTVHPAFTAPPGATTTPAPAAPRRSSDLVLIYPDFVPSSDTVGGAEPESDPFDHGPILAPDEIERVLYAPRRTDPRVATAMAATEPGAAQGASSPASNHPLVEQALRTVPTFSRALIVAAGMVSARLS
jgi:hypothetical protein